MSEQINNREYRKKVIKEIITELHQGKTVEEVKKKFEDAFEGVSATEITEAEQALIAEGLPIEEVQRLCDVHSAAFKGSIEEIHRTVDVTQIPGHPTNIMIRENKFIEDLIENQIRSLLQSLSDDASVQKLSEALETLATIDIHYSRKENLFFPYMEKYGITAPPKVMWGVDDEIRDRLKEVRALLDTEGPSAPDFQDKLEGLLTQITEMIYKEENILLPMLLDTLTQDEWKEIADESPEIGYIIDDIPVWDPTPEAKAAVKEEMTEPDTITLPSGVLKKDELVHMLNALPIDITFVDKNDVVKYFSQSSERIFARPKTVLGRKVVDCHPPASVDVVAGIVDDFKNGKKDHEDFWINMGSKYVLIRYFAVRDENGEYLGVVEVTQDIKPIQQISGEKRLVSQ